MTRLYDGFIALLQSSCYNVLESSIGRHSSILGTDFNFGGHSAHLLGYLDNPNFDTQVWHSVSTFNFNFGGPMSWARNTYNAMPSTYTGWQFDGDLNHNVWYRRTDDLLIMFRVGEGAFNSTHASELLKKMRTKMQLRKKMQVRMKGQRMLLANLNLTPI